MTQYTYYVGQLTSVASTYIVTEQGTLFSDTAAHGLAAVLARYRTLGENKGRGVYVTNAAGSDTATGVI